MEAVEGESDPPHPGVKGTSHDLGRFAVHRGRLESVGVEGDENRIEWFGDRGTGREARLKAQSFPCMAIDGGKGFVTPCSPRGRTCAEREVCSGFSF